MRISRRARLTRPARRARLRTRVLAGVMSVTLAALAAFDIAAVSQMHRYLISRADAQLRNIMNLLEPLSLPLVTKAGTAQRAGRPALGTAVSPMGEAVARTGHVPLRDPGDYHVWFMAGLGQTGYTGGNPALALPDVPYREFLSLGSSHAGWTGRTLDTGIPIRMMVGKVGDGQLIVTLDLRSVSRSIAQLERILIIGSAAAALIVALGGGWLIRRGLRPIEAMAAQADRITAGDLTDRVAPADAGTEVGRLGAALNGMLARIEASVAEREASQQLTRRFFADASHELRNPLASLRANAELYQQRAIPGRPDVDETMQRISEEAQRMGQLVDDMLRLARLDQAPGQQRGQVDLTALAEDCTERAHRTSPGRSWRLEADAGLVTEGDQEMLRRALDNLLANVGTHTPDGTTATITAASHDGQVRIEVSDDGPGVPASELPRIFDRFYRAGAPPQRRGSGLGLAIAAAIAAAHHGTVQASLNEPHGLRVTLTLPSVPLPSVTLPSAALARVPAGQASFRS
jgi:two-component system, OmpR family, sensor kinase